MLWVVIPGYNEGSRIAEVIKQAKRYAEHVVVVDDGSKDDTEKVARKQGAIVFRHIINLGKGAALKTGCDYAVEQGAEQIIVIDSDGQHDPKDIPRFLKGLQRHDIVFGQRRFDKHMPWLLKFGNSAIDFMVKILYGLDLQDTQCGYRAFTGKAYKKVRWKASDYSMESEMIANAGRNNLKYTTVKIATVYTDKYKGTTVLDGIKIVSNMVLWRMKGAKVKL
ncbi:MAG: glycosyltransferase family 2 protein [Nanoarchaeota archaeon]